MTATRLGKPDAALRRSGKRAAGAVAGQLSQALASFALQLAVARVLGASGLGLFAVLYGAIVLGTAISTGMVGDSLTVLDRSDRRIRIALARWCLLLAAGAGLLSVAVTVLIGSLSVGGAVLFGLAATAFMVEDALRRMLMATMQFWSLPLVDGTSLAVSLATLVIADAAGIRLSIGVFLFALLAGQSLASLMAFCRLPRAEWHLSPRGDAAMQQVFDYGFWRSLQLCVRPATLTAARIVITVVAGVTAYGQLEAARVYMAPALLLVSGIGSYLLPTYVAQRNQPMEQVVRSADRVAAGLLTGTLVLGVVGTLTAPLLGAVITGGDYELDAVAVLGWAVYAASSAALLPYTGLAAVRGRQRKVTAIRTIDPILSLILVAPVAAFAVAGSPYALAVGSFLAGVAIRLWVLRPSEPTQLATLEVPPQGGAAEAMGAEATR